ncbi:hypothetical protein AB0J55_17650 [Amycolatopsis sp. NPDC049688]|uniref:hypothetical protein n=1 Tax=Amycolatopsis sp. NPDC049688 TaxID=3154733 RepID=UPI0034133249
MTEQPTTPPPAGRTPTLGRGLGRWSAHIDGDLPPTEPYQPPTRTRPPGGWPKTGNLGATARLEDDELPVTVPARPYADVRLARGQHPDRVAQFLAFDHAALARSMAAAAATIARAARAIGWFRR